MPVANPRKHSPRPMGRVRGQDNHFKGIMFIWARKPTRANPPPSKRPNKPARGYFFFKKSIANPGKKSPSAIISEARPKAWRIVWSLVATARASRPITIVDPREKIITDLEEKEAIWRITSWVRERAPVLMAVSKVDIIAANKPINRRSLKEGRRGDLMI
jgi:hypothetical protein